MKYGIICLLLFVISGCGATGPAFQQLELSDDLDLAEVIVFRKGQFVDGGGCYQVNVNGMRLGVLANGGFLRMLVVPGKQTIEVLHVNNTVLKVDVESKNGETNYIEYNSSIAGGYIIPIGNIVGTNISFNNSLAEVKELYALSILEDSKDSSEKPSCMATIGS